MHPSIHLHPPANHASLGRGCRVSGAPAVFVQTRQRPNRVLATHVPLSGGAHVPSHIFEVARYSTESSRGLLVVLPTPPTLRMIRLGRPVARRLWKASCRSTDGAPKRRANQAVPVLCPTNYTRLAPVICMGCYTVGGSRPWLMWSRLLAPGAHLYCRAIPHIRKNSIASIIVLNFCIT